MLPHGHAGIFVILREIFQFHGNFTNGRGAVSLSCDEQKEATWHLVIRRLRQLLWSSLSDQGYPQSDISKNLGSFPPLLSANLYNFNSWSFYFMLSFTAIRIRTEGGGGRIESGGCWRKGNMRTILINQAILAEILCFWPGIFVREVTKSQGATAPLRIPCIIISEIFHTTLIKLLAALPYPWVSWFLEHQIDVEWIIYLLHSALAPHDIFAIFLASLSPLIWMGFKVECMVWSSCQVAILSHA